MAGRKAKTHTKRPKTKAKARIKRQRVSSRASTSSNYRELSRCNRSKSKGEAKCPKRCTPFPKKAVGPFMYYCKLNRKTVQLQNPNLSFGDIGRVLGSQWCAMDDKDKKMYFGKAQTDKRRYAQQMKRYAK